MKYFAKSTSAISAIRAAVLLGCREEALLQDILKLIAARVDDLRGVETVEVDEEEEEEEDGMGARPLTERSVKPQGFSLGI